MEARETNKKEEKRKEWGENGREQAKMREREE